MAPLGTILEPFELEDPCPSGGAAPTRTRCGIFPLKLCCCFPSTLTSVIPATFHTIQDETHLVLILGIFANLLIISETIHSLVVIHCTSIVCIKEVLYVVFTLPCTFYFLRVVGQYDERLQAKQSAVKEQRKALTRDLINTICEMDDLLSRSAESSAGLAEQSFESKRRDFTRFLERVKTTYVQLSKGPQSVDASVELLDQFRSFVCNWLKVFEECSIDPVSHPRLVVERDELSRCKSIAEICDLAMKRLEVTEIRFISQQREEDSRVMDKERDVARRVSVLAIENTPANVSRSFQDARSFTSPSGTNKRQKPMDAMKKQEGKWDSMQLSWLNFGIHSRCGYRASDYDAFDGYFPIEFQILCCTFTMLSREHLVLIMGFLAAIAVLYLELARCTDQVECEIRTTVIVEIVFNALCLIVLLVRFEEIDVIQQLEREVRDLQKTSSEVGQQHQQMNEFWANAMDLSELWLYRTVPRLDLYKEIHQHIEDTKSPQVLTSYLVAANRRLEDLEANLGQLEQWRQGGEKKFSTEEKKQFMQVMNKVCRAKEPDQQVDLLSTCVERKKALDSWSETRKPNGDAGKVKKIADCPVQQVREGFNEAKKIAERPVQQVREGLEGLRSMVKGSSPKDAAALKRAPSEVEGFMQSNGGAFSR